MLYLIEILHQTTTTYVVTILGNKLYLIEILHQTTTQALALTPLCRCILSKFYIKPQLIVGCFLLALVVSYRNSTSNHNDRRRRQRRAHVVSYRNSTSNHNNRSSHNIGQLVVSYRNSTSNHNYLRWIDQQGRLYLIEILHQTTTATRQTPNGAKLYLIEILHQTTTAWRTYPPACCCILSKFYIKPQP